MTTRYFTPAEASRTLPLVKQIVTDILASGRAIRDAGPDPHNPVVRKQVAEMNRLLNELEQVGCSYKDWNFEMGLVDFPALLDGEEVLLCWRSDEPELKYYHGLTEGFAGRKPIPSALLSVPSVQGSG
jgi:hypothetical protein